MWRIMSAQAWLGYDEPAATVSTSTLRPGSSQRASAPRTESGVTLRNRASSAASRSGSWQYSMWRWISDTRRPSAVSPQIVLASRRVTARSIARSSSPVRHSSSRIARTAAGSAPLRRSTATWTSPPSRPAVVHAETRWASWVS
jgi:hypothetical protein